MGATCNLYTGWRGGDRGVHSGGAAAHGAAGGARGGVPVGRAERGGGDAEPERHEQAGGAQALVALLLLRPRAAAEHPQEVARQEGERRRRAGRLRRPVQGQLRGHAWQVRRLRRRGRRRIRELVRQGVQVLSRCHAGGLGLGPNPCGPRGSIRTMSRFVRIYVLHLCSCVVY